MGVPAVSDALRTLEIPSAITRAIHRHDEAICIGTPLFAIGMDDVGNSDYYFIQFCTVMGWGSEQSDYQPVHFGQTSPPITKYHSLNFVRLDLIRSAILQP